MHFSGSGHNAREVWRTSHCSRHRLIISPAQSFPDSSSRSYFLSPAMTHRAVTQTAWATWTFYSTQILLSVSWPASPARRDRTHLTHLSAGSQVVIRACQPRAAWALKKQMLLIHSSQFCSVFLPPCQSLPSFGQHLLPLTAPTTTFPPVYVSDAGAHPIFLSSYAPSSPVCSFHCSGGWFSWFGKVNSMVTIKSPHPLKVSPWLPLVSVCLTISLCLPNEQAPSASA